MGMPAHAHSTGPGPSPALLRNCCTLLSASGITVSTLLEMAPVKGFLLLLFCFFVLFFCFLSLRYFFDILHVKPRDLGHPVAQVASCLLFSCPEGGGAGSPEKYLKKTKKERESRDLLTHWVEKHLKSNHFILS